MMSARAETLAAVNTFWIFMTQWTLRQLTTVKKPGRSMKEKKVLIGKRNNGQRYLNATYCWSRNHADGVLRWLTSAEQRLHQIRGECDGRNALRQRIGHCHRHPECDKARQPTPQLVDVNVIAAGTRDQLAQTHVTDGSDGWQQAAQCPKNQRHGRGSGVDENTSGWDENARTDHITHNDGHSIRKSDGPLRRRPRHSRWRHSRNTRQHGHCR